MDQDSTFMSSLMNYQFHTFDIKIKTVVPHNHHSLQAEHGIKSLSNILTKHLTNLGQMCPKYLQLATFAYNTFNTLNYSPYDLVFGRKPKSLWIWNWPQILRSLALSRDIMNYLIKGSNMCTGYS